VLQLHLSSYPPLFEFNDITLGRARITTIAAVGRRKAKPRQSKAKQEGRYKGRPEDTDRNEGIASLLAAGRTWGAIQRATGCSRATIAKIAKRLKAA
jgi:DNA invertase Pin-like site-specific DNA recombinase